MAKPNQSLRQHFYLGTDPLSPMRQDGPTDPNQSTMGVDKGPTQHSLKGTILPAMKTKGREP